MTPRHASRGIGGQDIGPTAHNFLPTDEPKALGGGPAQRVTGGVLGRPPELGDLPEDSLGPPPTSGVDKIQ